MPRSFPTLFDLFNNDTTTALYFQCILIAPNSDIYRFAIPVPVDYDYVRRPCFLWQRQHTFNTPSRMHPLLSYPSCGAPCAPPPTFIIFPSYCYLQPSIPGGAPCAPPGVSYSPALSRYFKCILQTQDFIFYTKAIY